MTRSRAARLILPSVAVLCGLVYLVRVPRLEGCGLPIVKAVPVLLLAAWAARASRNTPGRLVAAGLGASAFGDFLLDLGADTFLPGVAAFALAHVLYTLAFARADRRLRPLTAVPFVLWGGLVLWRVMPGLGPESLPVAAYVAVISVMMWRATAQAAGVWSQGAWLGLIGAVLFGASDTLIALGRWGGLAAGGWLVMVLYWTGQLGIAGWGVVRGFGEPARPSGEPSRNVVESMCERAGRPPDREESPGSGGQGAR